VQVPINKLLQGGDLMQRITDAVECLHPEHYHGVIMLVFK
jgi:hypothetical protein